MAKARYKTKQMTELHTFCNPCGTACYCTGNQRILQDREIAVGTTTIYGSWKREKKVWLKIAPSI